MATVNLFVEYFEAARQGDRLETEVKVRKAGRRLVFADCLLKVGERDVARSTAVFPVVGAVRDGDGSDTIAPQRPLEGRLRRGVAESPFMDEW